MTAEIVVMNREAVAMSADSATTIEMPGGSKMLTSANKLFALSKDHPVGVMIHDNASFMRIPWETIICLYTDKLGNKQLETLSDYAEDFIDFIIKQKRLYPKDVQEKYFRSVVSLYFSSIRDDIEKFTSFMMSLFSDKDANEVRKQQVANIIDRYHKSWEEAEKSQTITEEDVQKMKKKYNSVLNEQISSAFDGVPLTQTQTRKLKAIACDLFYKFPDDAPPAPGSGVVFAGFGKSDLFPRMVYYRVESVVSGFLKYRKEMDEATDQNNTAGVYPFAQKEMLNAFMQGAETEHSSWMWQRFRKVLSGYHDIARDLAKKLEDPKEKKHYSKLIRELGKEVKGLPDELMAYEYRSHTLPTINIISSMSKNELSYIAESLVNLTLFKQRMSLETETAAGDIDVAIITRSDGFIWIKQKHYFKPELNPQFIASYYRGLR